MNLKIILFLFILSSGAFSGCKPSKNTARNQASEKSLYKPGNKEISFKRNFLNGSKEKILGNYDMAASYFNKCLKLRENHAASMYELASIYEHQGNDALALQFSKRSVEIDDSNEWYKILLANLYKKHGKFNESAKIFEQLTESYPYKTDYLFEWANSLIYQGELRKAIEVYDELEKTIGVTEQLSKQKEGMYLKLGDNDKAIEEIKKLIDAYPKEANYYGMLAELYHADGKHLQALEIYNELLEMEPDNALIRLSLADYYHEIGDKEKSFEQLKIAFANPNADIDAKVQILLSYYIATETSDELKQQAHELNELLTEAHPEEAKSFSIYGDFLYRDNKKEEAREKFRKAITLDKNRFAIWNQVLLIDEELHDYNSMLEESGEAIEFFPNQPILYLFNGLANIQKKKYTNAIAVLNQGKDFVVDNPLLLGQFFASLGDAYHKSYLDVQSDSAYDKALEIDPNNTFVLNNYSYFLSLRGENLEKAEKMSKRAVDLEPDSPSFLDTYAWILYQSKRYSEAKEWIDKAINSGGGNSSVILEHCGDILYRLNDNEGALRYWKKASDAGQGSDLLDKKIADKRITE